MFRWLNGPSNDLYRKGNKKAHIRLIFWLSVLFNALFFAAAIAHNPPAWYTNDDFRMMTIVSGAYTGDAQPGYRVYALSGRAAAVVAIYPHSIMSRGTGFLQCCACISPAVSSVTAL